MKVLLCILLFAGGYLPLNAVQVADTSEGYPFGKVNDEDIAHLMAFAKAEHADLSGDLELAYRKSDDAALSRAFLFSLKLRKLDDDARTYGQIIFSSFLNLGDAKGGIERYSHVVAAQPKPVRQRIRDFIFYPETRGTREERVEAYKAVREEFPLLFPADYVFGSGNPLFKDLANQLPDPTSPAVTPPAKAGVAPSVGADH